jgi:hypothetical protein
MAQIGCKAQDFTTTILFDYSNGGLEEKIATWKKENPDRYVIDLEVKLQALSSTMSSLGYIAVINYQ